MTRKMRNPIRSLAAKALLAAAAAALVCAAGSAPGAPKAPRREAALLLSDDTMIQGTVLLTPGRSFSLTLLEPGQEPASNKGFNKVRNFNVDVIREMTFKPYRESYERKFTISDADIARPVYHGEPYPVRELQCSVLFNNGETRSGILRSTAMYLKEKNPNTGMTVRNRRFLLAHKQKSEPGDKLSDLVYVKRIKMLDEGEEIEKSLDLEFLSLDPGSTSELKAMTEDTLTSVPVRVGEGGKGVEVLSTFGESVLLAARIGDRYVAGWPEEGVRRTELFESVEEQLKKKEDYYNERKLLGILPLDNGRKMLTLVSLRRQLPPNVGGYAGSFEFDRDGNPMEFFRLSVWLWRRAPETGAISLIDRGTFFRVRVDDNAPTPPAGICPDLWPIVKTEGKILVGKENEG